MRRLRSSILGVQAAAVVQGRGVAMAEAGSIFWRFLRQPEILGVFLNHEIANSGTIF